MPLIRSDEEKVLHIRYNRERTADQESLRSELARESFSAKPRDTILELTDSTMIYSAEIGIIIQFVKTLAETDRCLRLVASTYVCEMLTTMNVHRIPKIVLYNNMDEVQELFSGVDLKGRGCSVSPDAE